MRIVCWQRILMKYHTLFFRKLGKMSQNLSSAAVVIAIIAALRVKDIVSYKFTNMTIGIIKNCTCECVKHPYHPDQDVRETAVKQLRYFGAKQQGCWGKMSKPLKFIWGETT